MRICSEQESGQLVSICIDQYPEAIRLPFLKYWNSCKLAIHITVLLFSVLLGIITTLTYKDVISSVIEKIYCGRLVMAVTGFITIVAAVLLCVCIHEFIHMLGYKLCRCNCVLVYSKPLITISVMGSEWLTKKQALFVTLLPFLVIDALSFFVFLITKNSLLLMWLLLINTALAGSDLVCVFVLAKTPKSSLTLGHYMRKQ